MKQKKQNNQEGMKKVTIISNEHIYKLAPFTKKCSSNHNETIIEFLYETGIEIPVENIYRTSSQELAYELVTKGFCVLLYNDLNQPANLTVYLPKELSYEQRQYFELAISMLDQCNLSVFTISVADAVFQQWEQASESIEALMACVNTIPESTPKVNEVNNIKSLTRQLQSTTEPKNS